MEVMNSPVDVFLDSLREKNVFIKLNDHDNLDIESPKGVLAEDMIGFIKQNKEEIIDYLKAVRSRADIHREIPVAPESDSYPLSSAQTQVWVSCQVHGAEVYNIVSTYELEEEIDAASFRSALEHVIARHEILRTVFRRDDAGQTRQWILRPSEVRAGIEWIDWTDGNHSGKEVRDYAARNMQYRIFDLETAPLFELVIFKLGDGRSTICCNMHHIITDAWSTNVLIHDLLDAYNALKNGQEVTFSPLRIQYKDYAVWQQDQLTTPAFQAHEKYWLDKFDGELPVIDLIDSLMRPTVKTTNGRVLGTYIGSSLATALKELCVSSGTSLFAGLVSSLIAILYKYTGHKDLITGMPVSGRDHPDLQSQIGYYINTIALRSQCDGSRSFLELLNATSGNILETYEHQAYPFDRLVERLGLKRDTSRAYLYDIFINFQNITEGDAAATGKGKGYEPAEGPDGITDLGLSNCKFDLVFNFAEAGEDIHLAVEFNRDIYSVDMVERLIGHYRQLLLSITQHPSDPLDDLNYLSQKELDIIGGYTNGPDAIRPAGTVVEAFTAQVRLVPESPALRSERHTMTYKELGEASNRVANYLLSKGARKEMLIGLYLDRSIEAVVSILGILKSGAAFLPVDTSYPLERAVALLADSGTQLVVTGNSGFDRIGANWKPGWVHVDPMGEGVAQSSAAAPDISIDPSQLAYVLYTSGSTGLPKGVLVEHGSLMNYLSWVLTAYCYPTGSGNFGLYTSLCFDLTFTSLFGALVKGQSLYIYSQDMRVEDALKHYLGNGDLNILKLTPAHIRIIETMDLALTHIDRFIVGGEQLGRQHVEILQKISRNPVIYNEYGPTEATVGCSVSEIHGDDTGTIHIGRPIINTSIHILSQQGQPVGIGFTGEICIGGIQVARGYHNMDELTRERFMEDPCKKGGRLYKSGDYGRWLPGGNIEYIGRKDDQVKIRGYRVELREVEMHIRCFKNINDVAVVVRSAVDGDNELVAFIISDGSFENSDLRAYLKGKLPEYMLPAVIIHVAEFPLTANGKVDRKKLLQDVNKYAGVPEDYAGPENEVQSRLAEIWKVVLAADHDISIRESFFELGGHSIKAIKMLAQVSKEFKVIISVGELFEDPTIQRLSERIYQAGWAPASTIAGAVGSEFENVKI